MDIEKIRRQKKSTNLIYARMIDNTTIINDIICGTTDNYKSPMKKYYNSIVNNVLDFKNCIFIVEKEYEKCIPYIFDRSRVYILDSFDVINNNHMIIHSTEDIKNIKKYNTNTTINIFCFDKIEKIYTDCIDYIYDISYTSKTEYKIVKQTDNIEFLHRIPNNYIVHKINNASSDKYDNTIIIRKYILNHQEYQYLNLIKKIYNQGDSLNDRTGFGTMGLNGESMKFNIQHHFPLITTKFTSFKCILHEFLWFMSGSTDNNELQKHGVHIWDGNTSKEFITSLDLTYAENDGGTIYGFNFRKYGGHYINCKVPPIGGIDQVQNVIDNLRKNPTSRRHIIDLWDPSTQDKAVLPPCHMIYQFLSDGVYLDCVMFQRSADVGLGLPFNIASTALFTYAIGHLTKLQPRNIILQLGNAHIYNNHSNLQEILNRDPLQFPKLVIKNRNQKTIDDFIYDDFMLENYNHYTKIKMNMNV